MKDHYDSAALARASEAAAGKPVKLTCPHCGLTDIEYSRTCHNSACMAYARAESFYRGWNDTAQKPANEQQISQIVYAWLKRAGVTVHEDRVEELIGYLSAVSGQQAARGQHNDRMRVFLEQLACLSFSSRDPLYCWQQLTQLSTEAKRLLGRVAAKGDGHE